MNTQKSCNGNKKKGFISQATVYDVSLFKANGNKKLTLKMETAMFAETLDNSQHLTRLTPPLKSRSYTLNPSRENLKTRTVSGT
jgi:hypothetical protein